MYTLLKPVQVRERLLSQGLRVFTAREFAQVFGISLHSTKYFLENQTKNGLFSRLKRGLYFLRTDPPAEEEMANALYRPSYLSFEYALSYYQLIPEVPYVVTSATTKPTRLFTTSSATFSYRTIKREAFTGYLLTRQENKLFLIAEKEKALVDYLYFVVLGTVTGSERLFLRLRDKDYYQTRGLNKSKIREYTKPFNNQRLVSLIDSLL